MGVPGCAAAIETGQAPEPDTSESGPGPEELDELKSVHQSTSSTVKQGEWTWTQGGGIVRDLTSYLQCEEGLGTQSAA